MAEQQRSESTEVRSAAVPTPCIKGCGFYGTSSTLDMCSKCYREHLRQEEQRLQVESVCQQQQQQQQQQKQDKEQEMTQGSELHDLPSKKEQGEETSVEVAQPSQGFVAESCRGETSEFVQSSQQEERVQQGGAESSRTAQEEKAAPKPKSRCQWCNKKVGLTGFSCRCGYTFCSEHRYSDKHNCSFDFKSQNKEILSKANPQVVASKINKI
jgi:hypothetical protein